MSASAPARPVKFSLRGYGTFQTAAGGRVSGAVVSLGLCDIETFLPFRTRHPTRAGRDASDLNVSARAGLAASAASAAPVRRTRARPHLARRAARLVKIDADVLA